MVYLTGDTHNEFTRLSNKYFKKYDWEIGENDYIIVCGDLGLCWSRIRHLNGTVSGLLKNHILYYGYREIMRIMI